MKSLKNDKEEDFEKLLSLLEKRSFTKRDKRKTVTYDPKDIHYIKNSNSIALEIPNIKTHKLIIPKKFVDQVDIEVKNYSANVLQDYLKTNEVTNITNRESDKIRLSNDILDVEITEIDKNVIKDMKKKRDSSKNISRYELF